MKPTTDQAADQDFGATLQPGALPEAARTDTLQEPELWLLVRVGMLVGGLGYWHPACIGIHEKLLDSRGFLQWTLGELGRLYRLPAETAGELSTNVSRRKVLQARLVGLRAMWDRGAAASPDVYEEVMRRREEMACYVQRPIIEQTWQALLRVYGDEIWQFVVPYQNLCDAWGMEDQLGVEWRRMRETLGEYPTKWYE